VQARRPRARRRPRRDAGNTRGTGTRSRSSGKQKSVVRIGFRAPRHAERQCVGGRTSSKQTVVALTRAMVGPAKGLASGGVKSSRRSPRGGDPTEARVQARVRAKRCASRDSRRQKRGTCNSVLSGTARCQVGVAATPYRSRASSQEKRHDGRRLGSFLHSLSRERIAPYEGGRWNDPGYAGQSDSARSRRRTGRQLPVGLEPNRLCPRTTWDVRGRNDFGEGSSSRRKQTTKREGSASRTLRGVIASHARTRYRQTYGKAGAEGASKSNRPKRAPANSSATPSQVQAARTALVRGGLPRRTKVRGDPRARARTAKSVFSRKG